MKKIVWILLFVVSCKEVYNPQLKNQNPSYLVVEGDIIAGNDSTIVHLSRTIPINDSTVISNPETNATVKVESEDGESYELQNEFNGAYVAPPLNINIAKNYRVHVFTSDGKEFASDYVPVKISPPIDSVSWRFDSSNGVNVYVSTHDAERQTLYYQWDFTETWQHHTTYTSGLIYDNGAVRFRRPDEQIHDCWTVMPSGSISIFSTTQLSSDVVFENRLVNIPYGDEKLMDVYSIQVKQYALTKEAFEFWQNLKKNTEQLGSIFDPQPFADFGNVHCVTDPNEPALGFISASSVQEQRIYIYKSDLSSWPFQLPVCPLDTIPPASPSLFTDGAHIPLYLVSIPGSPSPGTLLTVNMCADCRVQGGSTIKPPYMP